MEYKMQETNSGIGYKAMQYLSNMKDKAISYVSDIGNVAKVAAVTGLVAIVLATSGCARTSGGSASLLNIEWGDKTVFTKDEETKKAVVAADAKYEDTTKATPGKGFGFTYDKKNPEK